MAGWITCTTVSSFRAGESGVRRRTDLCATFWLVGKEPGAGPQVQGTWLALVCVCDCEGGWGYMGMGFIICIVITWWDLMFKGQVELGAGLRQRVE
ncbi:hypothetical protein PITC_023900 [Penicillium italicum]|uniref:Uncharacterized protein n=1 Tax=Penicillium italicum TaxID=40296 RepID=A0A0A2LD86_PENIT|nr:hypothetical protein PITC_023900 [Penicillium italicum]